ncbi:uncharacterized protein EI90DRAFT_3077210 [Cantharellus anzutake]|uniref:uncharacterized protein n=1 Tax=Cantharellus anzutake TaxID=1750568 RepID=UPI001906FAA8|nr:uncharacterized protein EI90DRAFT_3077210 [Cantharellus anzutake]KAF8322883.1 hypothetical protein EI90DRAFT_3077210 [Cantharellus anzutake]
MDHLLGPCNQHEDEGAQDAHEDQPSTSRAQQPFAYDMEQMQDYAANGPMPINTLHDESWFVAKTLLYSLNAKNKLKRRSLLEINSLRMRIGIMGIPMLGQHEWRSLFQVPTETEATFNSEITSILAQDDPLSQFDKIVELRRKCLHQGSLQRFSLDVLESLLVLVETADYITREDSHMPISPTFEHVLRSHFSSENPHKHSYDSCHLPKEITATMHWLNSYFYWGPIVVLAPPFHITLYRSTGFSKRFGNPEIDIWIALCNHDGCTLVDDRKAGAIYALEKLMRLAFDRDVAKYARELAIKLHSYDLATRVKRRHGRDRNATNRWEAANCPVASG